MATSIANLHVFGEVVWTAGRIAAWIACVLASGVT